MGGLCLDRHSSFRFGLRSFPGGLLESSGVSGGRSSASPARSNLLMSRFAFAFVYRFKRFDYIDSKAEDVTVSDIK